MRKLIIFDWDDVITLGAKEGYYQCYRETLKELGTMLPEKDFHERIQRRWGQPFKEELRELLLENPQLLDKAIKIFETKFWGNTFIDCLREVEGTNQVLKYLFEKYLLAVATGNHPRMLKEKIIPKFNIPDVFKQILTSFDVPANKTKPNPYMLNHIMKTLKIQPKETIYVGDAENDVQMASKAGVECIVVLTGHLNKDQALNLRVQKILPNITSLKEVL